MDNYESLGPEDLGKYVIQLIEQKVPAKEIGRVVESNMRDQLDKARAGK